MLIFIFSCVCDVNVCVASFSNWLILSWLKWKVREFVAQLLKIYSYWDNVAVWFVQFLFFVFLFALTMGIFEAKQMLLINKIANMIRVYKLRYLHQQTTFSNCFKCTSIHYCYFCFCSFLCYRFYIFCFFSCINFRIMISFLHSLHFGHEGTFIDDKSLYNGNLFDRID